MILDGHTAYGKNRTKKFGLGPALASWKSRDHGTHSQIRGRGRNDSAAPAGHKECAMPPQDQLLVPKSSCFFGICACVSCVGLDWCGGCGKLEHFPNEIGKK